MLPEIMFIGSLVIAYYIKEYMHLSNAMYFGLVFLLLFMFSEKF